MALVSKRPATESDGNKAKKMKSSQTEEDPASSSDADCVMMAVTTGDEPHALYATLENVFEDLGADDIQALHYHVTTTQNDEEGASAALGIQHESDMLRCIAAATLMAEVDEAENEDEEDAPISDEDVAVHVAQMTRQIRRRRRADVARSSVHKNIASRREDAIASAERALRDDSGMDVGGRAAALSAVALHDPATDTSSVENILNRNRFARPRVPSSLTDLLNRAPQFRVDADNVREVERLFREDALGAAVLHPVEHEPLPAKDMHQNGPLEHDAANGNIDERRAMRPMTDRAVGDVATRDALERKLLHDLIGANGTEAAREATDLLDAERVARMIAGEGGGNTASVQGTVLVEALMQSGGPIDQRELNEMFARGYEGNASIGSQAASRYLFLRLLQRDAANASVDPRIPISDIAERQRVLSHEELRLDTEEVEWAREPKPGQIPCVEGLACEGVVMRSAGSTGFVLASYKNRPGGKCVFCERDQNGYVQFNLLADNTQLPPGRVATTYRNLFGVPNGYCWEEAIGSTGGHWTGADPVLLHLDMYRQSVRPDGLRCYEQPQYPYPDPSRPVGAPSSDRGTSVSAVLAAAAAARGPERAVGSDPLALRTAGSGDSTGQDFH